MSKINKYRYQSENEETPVSRQIQSRRSMYPHSIEDRT